MQVLPTFSVARSLTIIVNESSEQKCLRRRTYFSHGIHSMESETCNYVSRFSAAMKRGSSPRCEPLAITQLVAAITGTGDLLSKSKPKAP